MDGAEELRFGRFVMPRGQRMLLADGKPVRLSARAIELLLALVEARGESVSKDELMSRAWPQVVVEEHNLVVQIHALRAALGADSSFIRTIPGRGYVFTATVEAVPSARGHARPNAARPADAAPTNIPAPVGALIGRETELHELLGLQRQRRLLTLAGPGGIGKTRLAVELARRLPAEFADGVWILIWACSATRSCSSRRLPTCSGCSLPPPRRRWTRLRRRSPGNDCCWCWTIAST